jgi:plasmid stabilization system protein ParE
MEEFEIVWTEPALTNLEESVAYLERRSPSAAEKVRTEILEHVETLKSLPFIGPTYPRDRSGRTREIVCRKYRIFYRVHEAVKRVEILAVWYGARQEPELPA